MQSKIKAYKTQLKMILREAAPKNVAVLTRLFPGNADSMKEMKTVAESEGEGVIYITYGGRKWGEKKGGGGYFAYDSFLIYIFSKNYSDDDNPPDTDIEILLEKSTDAIFSAPGNFNNPDCDYDFIHHIVNPVYCESGDFFMAILEIGRYLTYPI